MNVITSFCCYITYNTFSATSSFQRPMCLVSTSISQIPLPPRGYPPGIDFLTLLTLSTVKTVEQTHASPNRDHGSCTVGLEIALCVLQDRPVQSQDLAAFGTDTAAIMRDMFNSPLLSLGQFLNIPTSIKKFCKIE